MVNVGFKVLNFGHGHVAVSLRFVDIADNCRPNCGH